MNRENHRQKVGIVGQMLALLPTFSQPSRAKANVGPMMNVYWVNSSEDFFLEITIILGQNLFLVQESQTIFFPIRNVLENHDLGKRHEIWAKLYCPTKFFLAGTPM